MSGRRDTPPMGRGQTQTNLASYVGREYEFEDLTYSSSPPTERSKHRVTVRVVKNSSGIALLPKRLVTFKSATYDTEVDGYAAADATDAVMVDEWVSSSGVANADYFYVVVKGPTLGTTDPAAGALNVINVGDALVALTAAASTHSTTSGRVVPQTLSGHTAANATTQAADAKQILNSLARALSAKTTANSNADILIFMSRRWG